MNRKKCTAVVGITLLFTLLCNVRLFGQNVSARISAREAWVGSPIALQIKISNARNYSLPESLQIDGCDVRSAGTPSQSTQIKIFNGRRSESSSVTQRYAITPRRAGTFQIPELEINVDGDVQTTRPIQFVATKSETGDLLFVEIEGDKDKVYVGESLKLKLKLWIKPFGDQAQQIKLNEGHMWQMISDQTSWGAFTDRLRELAENRQRPSGETVLRKDADGQNREYYLYEIDATVYPNKPGKIDASDLQIVVDYPQSLGRSRDPFDSFFGGSSMFQDMMDDDRFSSPFGRRLTVSKARPVVAEVSVDSTEVVAVPTANQPADYRGAVGKYQIIAEAGTTNVSAGDPIELRIGIVGDGPMELVQAPPLHEIKSLTNDFQITDQSLAGFVQDETKVFLTSIRPRNEDVKQIPPIPFSFFNPTKEIYETVYTNPISIDVEEAEALDMNSIVSVVAGAGPTNAEGSSSDSTSSPVNMPNLDLRNDFSLSLAESRQHQTLRWWWCFAIVAPFCWLLIAVARILIAVPARFASPKSKATKKINNSTDGSELAAAIREFIANRTMSDCPTNQYAVGQLRAANAYDIAARLELLFEKSSGTKPDFENLAPAETVDAFRRESLSLLDSIDGVVNTARQRQSSKPDNIEKGSFKRGVTASMIVFAFLCLASPGSAAEEELVAQGLPTETLQTILKEANATYQAAERLVDLEPAKAKQMFETSAQRYQLLVEQGVRNDALFLNLANAWYQSDDTAKAIVNYHRVLWMNQGNLIARKNLLAIEKMHTTDDEYKSVNTSELKADSSYFRQSNKIAEALVAFTGYKTVQIFFAISSASFWLLVVVKTVRPRLRMLRWCVVPFLCAVLSAAVCYQIDQSDVDLAVVMGDTITLKTGDGAEFQTEATLEAATGTVVRVLGQRADWRKVRLPDDRVGWVSKSAIEKVAL